MNYTLVNNNNVTLSSGIINSGANFDGTNYLSNSGFLIPNSGFTISTWVKSDSYPDGSVIVGQWNYDNNSPVMAAINCNFGVINVLWSTNGADLTDRWQTPIALSSISDNEWHHLAFTYASNTGKIYLDSSFMGYTALNPAKPSSGISLGMGYNSFFNGQIDETAVWNRSLSNQEVYNLYYQGTGNSYPFDKDIINVPTGFVSLPRPKAYWKLDDNGSGNLSLIDSTINRYHLSGYGDTGILTSGKISSGALTEGNSWFRSNVPTTVRNQWNQIIAGDTTFSFWIKSPVPSEPYAMILDETEGFGVLGNTNGTFSLVNSFDQTFISGGDFSDGEWHHVAAIRGDSKLKLFVDNTYIDSVGFPGWSYINSGQCVSVLGILAEGLSKAPSGTIIDEIGVWTSGLNAKEISNLYYNGQGNTYPFAKPVVQTSGLTDRIIAYYKLDNTGNGLPSMLDSTPNKNNFNYTEGLPNAVSGIIGSGANLEFGGFMSLYEKLWSVQGEEVSTNPNGFSTSFWIRPTRYEPSIQNTVNQKPYMPYIGIPVTTGPDYLVFGLRRDGTIFLSKDPDGFSNQEDEATSYVIPLNEWTHIVLVANSPYGNVDLYINGQYISAFTSVLKNFILNLNPPLDGYSFYTFIIGDYYNKAAYAAIDEVGLWNKPLTTSEIYNLYYNGQGNSYPFDKPTIEPVINPPRQMPDLMNEVLAYYPFNPVVSVPGYFETVDYTRNNNTIQYGSPSTRFSIQSGIIGSGAGFFSEGMPSLSATLIHGTSGYNSLAPNGFGDPNTLAVSGFSVSFWARPQSYRSPYSEYFSLANPKISFRITTGSGISLGVGNSFQNEASQYRVPTGQWTHFVLNSNPRSGNFDLHVNGYYLSSFTVGSGVQYFDFDAEFKINGNGLLRGTIDEFGLWSRPLSLDDIYNLYYQGSGNTYPFARPYI